MIRRILSTFLLVCFVGVGAVILFPCGCRSRASARRASCQSNLKEIGLALRQYARDNDDRLPPHRWAAPVVAYAKTHAIFQCPETPDKAGTSDYFSNAPFLGERVGDIEAPQTLVLLGDGPDGGPLNTTLSQMPVSWLTDEKSPLWRHLGGANYGFGDGHVKWLKVSGVSRDFRGGVKP